MRYATGWFNPPNYGFEECILVFTVLIGKIKTWIRDVLEKRNFLSYIFKAIHKYFKIFMKNRRRKEKHF